MDATNPLGFLAYAAGFVLAGALFVWFWARVISNIRDDARHNAEAAARGCPCCQPYQDDWYGPPNNARTDLLQGTWPGGPNDPLHRG